MSRSRFRMGICASVACAGNLAGSPADALQAARVTEEPLAQVLAGLVAPALAVSPERVRVDWAGDDRAADSVSVAAAGSGTWIATLWSGGASVRRFLRVGVVTEIPVAARQLRRGDTITSEAVRTEHRVVWSGGNAALDLDGDPVGMVASRAIAEGEMLSRPAVEPPLLVRGGQEVEALFEQPGVVMRMRAEALGSARMDESVYVRLSSGKRMAARAVDRGVVRLILGGA